MRMVLIVIFSAACRASPPPLRLEHIAFPPSRSSLTGCLLRVADAVNRHQFSTLIFHLLKSQKADNRHFAPLKSQQACNRHFSPLESTFDTFSLPSHQRLTFFPLLSSKRG